MAASHMLPDRPRAASVGFCILLVASLGGCGDLDPNGPISLEATETLPALHFAMELPSLPSYVERWGGGIAADGELAAWFRSWDLPRAEGEDVRGELHRVFAEVLGERVGPVHLEPEVERLEGAVGQIDGLVGDQLPAHLLPTLAEARAARDGARRALAQGDGPGTIHHLLEGFDRLRGATPEAVARELLAEGEGLLGEVVAGNGGGAVDAESILRAERLMIGARDALEQGAPIRALRRAWYAVRLLDEENPS